jgi:hypothetical protein
MDIHGVVGCCASLFKDLQVATGPFGRTEE